MRRISITTTFLLIVAIAKEISCLSNLQSASSCILKLPGQRSQAYVANRYKYSHNSRSQMAFVTYSINPVLQDIGCSVFTCCASLAWLQIWTNLANNNKIDSKLSRKIIHCGSAPLFICLWPLYSLSPSSRFYAAAIPFLQMIRLLVAGVSKDQSSQRLVATVSRTGDKKEALGGPLIYTIVLLLATVFFFRDSTVGVIAVTQMAAGDGLADIFGRRWGEKKWFFSKQKSYVGSLAFVLGAFLVSAGLLQLLSGTGFCELNVPSILPQLLLISVLCAAVELIPLGDDNITVPIAGGLLSLLLLEPAVLRG